MATSRSRVSLAAAMGVVAVEFETVADIEDVGRFGGRADGG